jgi:hypothetical protein
MPQSREEQAQRIESRILELARLSRQYREQTIETAEELGFSRSHIDQLRLVRGGLLHRALHVAQSGIHCGAQRDPAPAAQNFRKRRAMPSSQFVSELERAEPHHEFLKVLACADSDSGALPLSLALLERIPANPKASVDCDPCDPREP